jgi:hypothetical protein
MPTSQIFEGENMHGMITLLYYPSDSRIPFAPSAIWRLCKAHLFALTRRKLKPVNNEETASENCPVSLMQACDSATKGHPVSRIQGPGSAGRVEKSSAANLDSWVVCHTRMTPRQNRKARHSSACQGSSIRGRFSCLGGNASADFHDERQNSSNYSHPSVF